LATQDVSKWRGDVRCGKTRRSHLVQQWLEQVMVGLVHQRDANGRRSQRARAPQAGKAAAADHYMRNSVAHGI
jgi:hypothetical protein